MASKYMDKGVEMISFDELKDDPIIELKFIIEAGYTLKEGVFGFHFRKDGNKASSRDVYAAALKLKQEQTVPVTTTTGAMNGTAKADPLGSQLPSELTVAIPTFGSTKTPNKAPDKTPAASATNSNVRKMGIPDIGTPASSSSVPAAQPAQQTPPPPQREQKVVEVDYERIATMISSKLAAERQEIVRLVRLDLDPISRSDRSILAHFAPDDGQGNGGTVTTIYQLVKNTNEMVTEDRAAELELQYRAGAASRQPEISDLLKTIEKLENASSHSWGSFLWGYAFSLLTIVIIPVVVYLLLMLAGRV